MKNEVFFTNASEHTTEAIREAVEDGSHYRPGAKRQMFAD